MRRSLSIPAITLLTLVSLLVGLWPSSPPVVDSSAVWSRVPERPPITWIAEGSPTPVLCPSRSRKPTPIPDDLTAGHAETAAASMRIGSRSVDTARATERGARRLGSSMARGSRAPPFA